MSVGLLADVNHLWYDKYGLQDVEQRYYNPATCDGDSADVVALRKLVSEMQKRIESLEKRVAQLERGDKTADRTSRSSKSETGKKENGAKAATPAAKGGDKENKKPADDDDIDLFDDNEEEDEEKKRLYEERVKMYADKKAKKPALIAKSQVILEVKPWDDETDMKKLEQCVRQITMDGLLWGVSKLVPIAFGIKKLQIVCVVEDDKVSTDELVEQIEANEDFVQSVDIAAFQKI